MNKPRSFRQGKLETLAGPRWPPHCRQPACNSRAKNHLTSLRLRNFQVWGTLAPLVGSAYHSQTHSSVMDGAANQINKAAVPRLKRPELPPVPPTSARVLTWLLQSMLGLAICWSQHQMSRSNSQLKRSQRRMRSLKLVLQRVRLPQRPAR
jgi:hypothetical protein